MLRSLESGFLDAASLNPPTLFLALKKGFPNILDIGSLVEMPGGGLTVLAKDIKGKPDEVKRVIRAMQSAKDAMRKSKDKSVELMMRILKMDPESAAATYEVFLKTLSVDGIPTRAGMDNLVKSIQAQGRFVDKKPRSAMWPMTDWRKRWRRNWATKCSDSICTRLNGRTVERICTSRIENGGSRIDLRYPLSSIFDPRPQIPTYSASSLYNPSASVDGRSLIENRIASSPLVFSCECHCHDGTTKISLLSQLNSLAETLVIPWPRNA